MNEQIIYSKTTGKEIQDIVEAMEPVLEGKLSANVLMACLALAIIIQCPNLTPEQLSTGVRGASEWIALYASSLEPSQEKVN